MSDYSNCLVRHNYNYHNTPYIMNTTHHLYCHYMFEKAVEHCKQKFTGEELQKRIAFYARHFAALERRSLLTK